MASLRRKKYLANIPAGANIVERDGVEWAEWRDGKDRLHREKVVRQPDGAARIEQQTAHWAIRGRDSSGRSFEISTGCTDRKSALKKLSEYESVQERVRAGLMNRQEAHALSWVNVSLAKHREDYSEWQRARGYQENTLKSKDAYLRDMFKDLRWHTVRDLSRPDAEDWAMRRKNESDLSPRTFNMIVASAHAFGAWLLKQGRTLHNPFDGWSKLNERVDMRRERRAMTEDEIARFLRAAEERPLAEKLQTAPGLSETIREIYRAKGLERALMYRVLLTTGLRWGELRSITAGQVYLETDPAHIRLEAKDEKNRQGSNIPLRADVADDIRAHMARKRETRGRHTSESEWMAVPLFNMTPSGLCVFNRDLEWAGLDKRDATGRVLDIHALRHTFGTRLALSGVSLVIAQRAMRHSSPDLTANIYTHVGVKEIHSALETLPSLIEDKAKESVSVRIENEETGKSEPKEAIPAPCPICKLLTNDGVMDLAYLDTLPREELINILTRLVNERCMN